MIWNSVLSLRNFGRLVTARGFVTPDSSTDFNYPKNWLEKLGDTALKPLFQPADLLLRNIRNPLCILAMTASAIAALSIGFYPKQFFAIVYTILPFTKGIQPGQAKFALYLITQITILGLGLRTLGRQNNRQLMESFQNHQILPIPMGSIRV